MDDQELVSPIGATANFDLATALDNTMDFFVSMLRAVLKFHPHIHGTIRLPFFASLPKN